MNKLPVLRSPAGIFLGDSIVLVSVVLWGFSVHNTLGSGGMRIAATLIPMLLGWLLAALPFRLFEPDRVVDFRQLWRVVWAMSLAVPFALWLRGAWLGTPVQPVFVLVILGMNTAAFLLWRGLFALLAGQRGRLHG